MVTPLPTDSPERRTERQRFAHAWGFVSICIMRSNALWRLLYAGEELRKTPCPVHKGRWSGIGDDPDCGCWNYERQSREIAVVADAVQGFGKGESGLCRHSEM